MGISVKDALSRRYANSTNRSNRYEDQEEEEKSNGGVSVNEALSRWKINTKVQETPIQYANPQRAQQNQVQTPVLDASKAAAAERAKRREEKRQAAGVALPSSATSEPVAAQTETSGLRAMPTGTVKQVGSGNAYWNNLSDDERARIIAEYNDEQIIQQAETVNKQYDEKMAAYNQANAAYDEWLKKNQSDEVINAMSADYDAPEWVAFRAEGERLFAEAKKYDDEADALRLQADALHDQALYIQDMRRLNELLPKMDEETRKALDAYAEGNYGYGLNTNSKQYYELMARLGVGEREASRLAETWKRHKNKEGMEAFEEGVAKYTRAIPGVTHAVANLQSISANVVAPFTGFLAASFAGLSGGRYRSADPNGALFAPTAFADTVRQTTASDIAGENGNIIRQGVADIYNGAMGAADNVLRTMMYGEKGTIVMAMDVFQRTVRNASASGATKEQALALGLASAGLEYATEQVSTRQILDIMDAAKMAAKEAAKDAVGDVAEEAAKKAASKTFVDLLKKGGKLAGKNYIEELPQEVISFWGNAAAEAVILRQDSDFNKSVRNYMAEQGMTQEEAEAAAWKDLLWDGSLRVAWDTWWSTLFQTGFATGVKKVMENMAKDSAEGAPPTTTPPTTPPVTQQKATEAVRGEKAAQEAQTPTAGRAVENIISVAKETGTVSNSQANAILQNPAALDSLLRLTGKTLPGTNSGNRATVKAAVMEMAGIETKAQETAVPPITTNPTQEQEQTQTQEQEQAAPQQMTPADEAALKLAQLTETKDYPGTETKVEPVEVQQQTEQQTQELSNAEQGALELAKLAEVENYPGREQADDGSFAMGAADKGFDPYSDLQYQYGNKPDRNGTVRDINVPNKDSQGRRVSDTAANLYGNKITETGQMVEEIERRIVEGDFGADVKSTTETIERATNEILAKNGDTKVTAQIVAAVTEGRTSDELVAKAMSMYTYLQQQSRFEEAGEMAVYLADLLRTAGRTLNIAKMTSKLTPEGQWAARQVIYRRADKKANSGKRAKKTNVAPSAKMEQEFKDVATAEETAVTEAGEELKRHLRGDAEKAAKKAASNAEAAIKKADRQAKKAADDGEKSDLDKAVESGLKAGKNAAKSAMQTETPTQDEVYSAIMDFINSKKKKLGNKQNKERSLRTLLEYYKNNDNFQQAWWAARRQADLAVSGDEQARAILDEFLYSADAMMEGDELLEGSVARKAAKEAAKGAGVDLGKLVTGTREEKTKAEIAVNQYVQSKYESTDENAKGMTRSVANAFRAEMEQRRDAIFDKDGAARDVMRKAVKESGYQLSSLLTATHKEKQAALEKAQEYVGDHYTFYWEQRNKYSDMVASEFYSELAQRRDNLFVEDGGSRNVMRKAARETDVKLSDLLTATQAEKQAALDGITKWVSEHYNLPGEEADMLSDLMAEEYYSELTERRNEKLKDDAGKRRVMRKAAKETGVKLSDLLTESLQNKQAALESIQEYVQEHYALPIEDAAVLAKTMQDAFFTDLAERQAKRLEAMFAPKEQTDKPAPKDTAQKLREFAAMGAYNEYGDINRASLKRLFGADGLQLSPELMEHYADLSDARRAEVDARIIQDIADKLPGDLAQSFRKWRYGMMLINPSSHANNIIGSFGQSVIQLLGRDNLSAVIQSIAKKATGGKFKPTRALLNWTSEADRKLFQMGMQDYGTLMHNNGEVANRIANGNRYDVMRDEVEQARRVMKFKGESKPVKVINKVLGAVEWVLDANSKLMGFEDAPFGRNAYAASIAMYMKANGLTEITTEARDFAIEQARICTLHDESVLFQLAKKHLPKAVVDAKVPFLKSAANIADRMFTYSPGGFVKFGNDLLKMAMYKNGDTDVAKQMQEKYTWAKAIDDFSAGTIGILGVFAGIALANAGLIRVNGTGSEEEREYEELMGAKPISAYIGGKWWDASMFSPFSSSLFTGAAIYESMVNAAEGEGSFEDIISAAFAISDPMLDMSVFSGLDGLMYAIRYAPEDQPLAATITAELITSYLSQYNSSFLRKFAYALDNKSRKAYNDGIVSSAVQEYEAQVPWLRSDVSQKYDIWGQPFAHNAIGGDDPLSIGLRTVSPFRAYDTHETEIDEELKRLMALNYDVLPSANNPKSITVKRIDENGDEISEKVKLTAEQYDIYQRVEGQASLEMAKLIMQSDLFKELPDEWKAKALNEGYAHTDGLGKEAALSEYEYELPSWLEGKKGVTKEVANAILEKVQKDYAGLSGTAFKKASDFGFTDEQASDMSTIVERYENLHKGESKNDKYRAILENTSGADRYKWLQVYGMTENQVDEMQEAQKYGISNEQYLDLRDYSTAQHESGNTKWDVTQHVNLVKAGLSDSTAKTVQATLDGIKGESKDGSVRSIQKLEEIADLGGLTKAEKENAMLYVLDDKGDQKYKTLTTKHHLSTDQFVDTYRAWLDAGGKKDAEKAAIAKALGNGASDDVVEAIWKVYEGK